MKIKVLAFASAADALGGNELELEVGDAATLDSLRAMLSRERPGLEGLWGRIAVAVNGALEDGDTVLREGDEVALLPPVSGGCATLCTLTDEPIDCNRVIASVTTPGCGAVVAFIGTVRDHHGGRNVTRINYSGYRDMAASRLREIAGELESTEEGAGIAVVHRLGALDVGEASVVIAVASTHRDAAYRLSREMLERLKREVPIWKQEHYGDGSHRWREEEPLGA